MAIFNILEGAPGQGKSYMTAMLTRKLLKRNKKWCEKTQIKRKIWSNIKFASWFEEEAKGYLEYWTDSNELIRLRDIDVIWDEIATDLDSRNWTELSPEMKRFLSQYRKRGIDIYANTQDFSMIDQRARLMITRVQALKKIIGSPDISNTKPIPKHIWGIIITRDFLNFKTSVDQEKRKYSLLFGVSFLTKDGISIYDTTQDIPASKGVALKHKIRYCEHSKEMGGDGSCTFCVTKHI